MLVGNFNPSIFHPEWFIRHEIVPAWDYPKQSQRGDEVATVATLPDLAQVEFQDQRKLLVMLNKFTLRSALASEHLTIKDIVTSTFNILQETPILQMGMNYQAVIQLQSKDLWRKFGEQMAPKSPWRAVVTYINDLDEEKQSVLGLWEMTMQMPRWDDLKGYIRPTIKVADISEYKLAISINNHVVIEDKSALTMIHHLNSNWERALDFGETFVNDTLTKQLGMEN